MIEEKQGIAFVSLPGLKQAGAVHGFIGRQGGVSEGEFRSLNLGIRTQDRPEAVAENDRRFRRAFGIPSLVRVRQVHGREVLVVDRKVKDEKAWWQVERDAVITDQPGVALAVLTADCVPIVLFDPERRAWGIAHAGWRGTCLRTAAAAVEAMTERFGSEPRDILAGIGPGVGPCCYPVDGPVIRAVEESFGEEADELMRPAPGGRRFLDLVEANCRVLRKAGIAPEHLEKADLCTSCRADLFFSHRRDRGRTGRQINFVMMECTVDSAQLG